jgi:hypothetical protein
MDERIEGRPAGREPDGGVSGPAAGRGEGGEDEGVLTLVCFKCGTEYYFSDGEPPPDLACGKCGNTVFRSYFSHEVDDEADEEYRSVTERDLHPDDAEGETLPGDLLDLDRG